MTALVALDHPRFRYAHRDLFTSRVVADCMSHECRLVKQENRVKLDACCQYGVDVDIAERDNILARREEIAAVLDDAVAHGPWFSDTENEDPDFPSGRFVRSTTHDGGCVFLAHDKRGCAIHRASIEGEWDFRGTKPHVCRLFPVSYDESSIVLSDDYLDYSCAYDASAPTVYRAYRDDLADIFGIELVRAMDRAEAEVLAEQPVALPVVR